jgi:hypothetical protein
VCSSLTQGEHAFLGAMKQVHLLDCDSLKNIATIETTEWVFAMCMLDDSTLICGQSYGYLDLVKVNRQSSGTSLETVLKTKFE